MENKMDTQPSLSNALTNRMDYLIARQGIVSGNIANAATPGYLAKDLTFAKALTNTNGTNTNNSFKSTESTDGMSLNGNSVQLDTEMLKLNEIQLNYQMATKLYSKYASMHRNVLGRQ